MNIISQVIVALIQFLVIIIYFVSTNILLAGIIISIDIVYIIIFSIFREKIEKYKFDLKESTANYSSSLHMQLAKLKFIISMFLINYFHKKLNNNKEKLQNDVLRNQKFTYWLQSGEMVNITLVGGIIIINLVAFYRKEFNLTQKDIGKIVGVYRQAIIAIESGKYNPSLILAYKIAKTFDKSIEEVFDFEGSL